MTPCNRTLWYGQNTRGLSTPQYGVRSLNTFTSVAPRIYSIICISSESCLWSIVGLPGSYAYYLAFCYIG